MVGDWLCLRSNGGRSYFSCSQSKRTHRRRRRSNRRGRLRPGGSCTIAPCAVPADVCGCEACGMRPAGTGRRRRTSRCIPSGSSRWLRRAPSLHSAGRCGVGVCLWLRKTTPCTWRRLDQCTRKPARRWWPAWAAARPRSAWAAARPRSAWPQSRWPAPTPNWQAASHRGTLRKRHAGTGFSRAAVAGIPADVGTRGRGCNQRDRRMGTREAE